MIVAYTALHYGLDYWASAIKSVRNQVDKWVVTYSAEGSHGHKTRATCPDSHDALYTIAHNLLGDKLDWHEGVWQTEGDQRDSIFTLAPDADAIVVVDSDEVWGTGVLRDALQHTAHLQRRNIRLPMWHYWRSFRRVVTNDPALPIRLIYPQVNSGEHTHRGRGVIHHFGYAQNEAITQYKIEVHGHKNEWRADWYDQIFLTNQQYDCHPVSVDHWTPSEVNPREVLPTHMQLHPYFNTGVIR